MLRLEYVGKFSEKFRQKLGILVGRNHLRTEYHDLLSKNDFSYSDDRGVLNLYNRGPTRKNGPQWSEYNDGHET